MGGVHPYLYDCRWPFNLMVEMGSPYPLTIDNYDKKTLKLGTITVSSVLESNSEDFGNLRRLGRSS